MFDRQAGTAAPKAARQSGLGKGNTSVDGKKSAVVFTAVGRWLFRWRGAIGFIGYSLVFWQAEPRLVSLIGAVPLLLAGLGMRFWAMGYLGKEARVNAIGGSERIVDGPYHFLRHPLYLGNALLVLGVLLALLPPLWLSAMVFMLFCTEYVLIVLAEEEYLSEHRPVSSGRSEQAETMTEDGDKRRAAEQSQRLRAKTRGQVDGVGQNRQEWRWERARLEWPTWLTTGVAYGLGWLKVWLVG